MEREQFLSVLSVVCGHFGVEVSDVVPMPRHWKASDVAARDYAVRIIHDHYGLSITETSLMFGFGRRNVSRITSRMRYLCSQVPDYADTYSRLLLMLPSS